MKNRINYIILASIALFSACSTDLEVIGDYKETMVVYGLLDQSQTKQYIKVNKAFLGEGGAFGYAQVKDSVQFSNSLNVVLKRLKTGAELNLTADNTIPKVPGVFYAPDQQNAIYSISTPAGFLTTDSDYQLIVKSNETGTTVSAQTSLLTDAVFTTPSPGSPFFGFILSSNASYQFPIRWTSGKNARLYQLIVRFNYIDSTSGGNITQRLDWVFPEQKTQKLSGGEQMKGDFQGQAFLKFVGNQLSDYSGLYARRALNAELILVAGGDDLNTFIEVNKPSTTIVQEKPEFTNITNGLGVFSSRYSKAPFSKPLAAITWDSLACGQYTADLRFLDHFGLACP
ncbi:MAG: hypothetical protein V4608_13770 [Bacteroidota bacterium]